MLHVKFRVALARIWIITHSQLDSTVQIWSQELRGLLLSKQETVSKFVRRRHDCCFDDKSGRGAPSGCFGSTTYEECM